MSVTVIDIIKPKNNGPFPTHEDVDALGGFQVQPTTTSRDSIPTLNRKEGMLVYVLADTTFYQLASNLTTWNVTNLAGSLSGDVTGAISSNTVIKLQGNAVKAGTLNSSNDGYVLTWVNTNSRWEAAPSGTSFLAGGDLSGSFTNQSVIKIHGASVPVSGSLTTGNVLQVNGTSSLTYSPINLAGGVNFITGVLPTANQASQSLGGDLLGTTGSGTVVALQGNAIQSGINNSSQDGYVLTWINGDSMYELLPVSAAVTSVTMGGDITGNSSSATVIKVDGVAYPASPSTNTVPVVTGSNTVTYQQIANAQILSTAAIAVSKLASGTSAQILLNNSTPTPAWTTVGGDAIISSTGSITNSKINATTVTTAGGSLTTGQVLRVTGSSVSDWGALDLANTNAITGTLATSHQASQTMGGDASGTTASCTITKIQGNAIQSGALGSSQDGYVLTWVNSGVAWEAKPVTSSSLFSTITISSTYTVDTLSMTPDHFILVNQSSGSGFTLTLPAPSISRVLYIKDIAGNGSTKNVTIAPHASETIDGSSSYTMNLNYAAIMLLSDGTNWYILNEKA